MQHALGPAIARGQPVARLGPLVEMLHSPAAVALLVQRRNPLHLVGRDPMRARLAQPPIEQPRRALGLIAHPPPPECPLRTAQPLRRRQRAQPAATVALVISSNRLSLPSCLTSVRPIPAPLVGAVPNPDRTPATQTGQTTF